MKNGSVGLLLMGVLAGMSASAGEFYYLDCDAKAVDGKKINFYSNQDEKGLTHLIVSNESDFVYSTEPVINQHKMNIEGRTYVHYDLAYGTMLTEVNQSVTTGGGLTFSQDLPSQAKYKTLMALFPAQSNALVCKFVK